MRMTPVGPRCPDHATAGKPTNRPPAPERVRRRVGYLRTNAPLVTYGMIGINVVIYLITVAQGFGINQPGGKIYTNWELRGDAVANGDWWRLITAAFLHGSVIHLGLNMLALAWLGAPVERYIGSVRYLGLYIASGLAGSAGALIATPPNINTVGASGAVFGILGALLIIEYQQTGKVTGQAFTLILINLAFSFTVAGISIGGHIGGLIGGILAMLAMSRFGRGHVAYGRPGLVGWVGLLAVAIASVVVAYWKVRGYNM
jgi:membrane associated rhomboid family serine protease